MVARKSGQEYAGQEPHTYALDRIVSLQPTDITFRMPDDWDAETFFRDSFGIITLHLRPTFDFQQELLWNGDDMEVLSPLWLRNEMAGKIQRMWNKYKE